MAGDVMTRLGNLLFELGDQLSQGCEILAEPFGNRLRWIKIDLEFVGLEGIEDCIVGARRIAYDAGQLFGSSAYWEESEVALDLIRRYRRIMKYYRPTNSELESILWEEGLRMDRLTRSVYYDETRGSIFGHHGSDWIKGYQGLSTIASGGQVVGVAEDEDCFVGLDEQIPMRDHLFRGRIPPCKEMNNHLNKETCKELFRRCGGLPLAIVQLGELMQTKDWFSGALAAPEIIFNSDAMKVRVLEVLAMSYNELPHELRLCFLYLRNVPADVEIEVNKLHQLWAAESLIGSHDLLQGESTLHLACYYLHVLASRSMVQLQVDEATGLFKYFRVHTLLRDVCFLKGNEEDLQVMDLRLQKTVVVEDKEVITKMPSSSPILRDEPNTTTQGGVFVRGGPSGVETLPGKVNPKIPMRESNTDDDKYVPDDEMDCIWQFGLVQSALLK
ncbi:hypothetical protein LguiA_002306 [Lonicera macranthoides]